MARHLDVWMFWIATDGELMVGTRLFQSFFGGYCWSSLSSSPYRTM